MNNKILKNTLLTTVLSFNVVIAGDGLDNDLTPGSKYKVNTLSLKLADMNTATRPQRAANVYNESVLGPLAQRLQKKFIEAERVEKVETAAILQQTISDAQTRKKRLDDSLAEEAAKLAAENDVHNAKIKEKLLKKEATLFATQEELYTTQEDLSAAQTLLLSTQSSLSAAQESLSQNQEEKVASDSAVERLKVQLVEAQTQGDEVAEAMFAIQISEKEKLSKAYKQQIDLLTAQISSQYEEIQKLTIVKESREAMLALEFPKTPAPKSRARKPAGDTVVNEASTALLDSLSPDSQGTPIAGKKVPAADNKDAPAENKDAAAENKVSGPAKQRKGRPNILNAAPQGGDGNI